LNFSFSFEVTPVYPNILLERSEEGLVFCLRNFPEISIEAKPKQDKKIALLWVILLYLTVSKSQDRSYSRITRNATNEYQALREILRIFSNCDISIFVFSNECEAPVQFRVINGDASPIVAHLKKVEYDGGTIVFIVVMFTKRNRF
jgi:hypothetical protein